MTRAIYAFKHQKTGKVYIGATTNLDARHKKWREKMSVGHLPARMADLFGDFKSVEFVVLQEFPDRIPMSKVHEIEAKWIAATYKVIGERLLNQIHAPTRRVGLVAKSTFYLRVKNGMDPKTAANQPPAKTGNVAATIIVDDRGRPMTHVDAAREIGCTPQTLWKRMKNKRHRFPKITTYRVADLKKQSKKWTFTS